MISTTATSWTRVGLFALPVYGLLTIWTTLDAQPDLTVDPVAWARFVSSTSYVAGHVVGSAGGTILAIFGTFALGAFLAGSRSARLGLAAMVVAAAGQALLLVPGGVSAFAVPALGKAYLNGVEEAATVTFPDSMAIFTLGGMLCALLGNVLLGASVWRSGTLPRWTGMLWIIAWVVFVLLGAALGMATTGASLPTQPVAAGLMTISGAGIAWSALHRPAAVAEPRPSYV